MPRRPEIEVIETCQGFKVETPASLSATGQRVRNFFPDEKDAEKHARALRVRYHELGTKAGSLDPADGRDATKALEVLAPWNKSLTEAAAVLAAKLEREAASVPFEYAADKWLEEAEGELRTATWKSYRYTVERLKVCLAGAKMSDIAGNEIEAGLRTSGATSYAMHRRNARALWRWSAKRGWCDAAVFASVAAPRKVRDGEITVLSSTEVRRLLESAEKTYPEIVPCYVVALFGGLRAEEIKRLGPQHVAEDAHDSPQLPPRRRILPLCCPHLRRVSGLRLTRDRRP